MHPGNIGTAFVWAVVPAALILIGLYAIDRYEKEPIRLIGLAVAFGAVLAPLVTVGIQKALGVPTSMVVQTAVPASRLNATTPIVEGLVLGLTVAVVCWLVRSEIDGLLDGVIYGASVAVGFGMTAASVAILRTPSLGQGVTGTLFSAMVAGLSFVLYGGLVGLAVAAVRSRSAAVLVAAAAGGTAVATVLRVVHDYLPSWVGSSAGNVSNSAWRGFLTGLPNTLGLVALAVIAVWCASRDASIVVRQLRSEVASGLVTPDEYLTVTHSLRRTGALLGTLVTRGAGAWRARRSLYASEVELAYAKERRGAPPGGPVAGSQQAEDPREAELRERIARSRAATAGSAQVAR